MTNDDLKEEIKKGLDDVAAGKVESFDNFSAAINLLINGDKYKDVNDIDKAEKCYLKASTIFRENYFKGIAYNKLGLLYYNFNKPDVLYSIIYFQLALTNGYMESSYYLANIYEQCKDIDGIDYNIDEIIRLYKIASKSTENNNIKELAIEGLNRNEESKLELK